MTQNYSFFQNKRCEFFPCHSISHEDTFNCLFCYCPLYALGDRCGGNCTFTEDGIKDCSDCLIPHSQGGYEYITSHFKDVAALAAQNRKK